MEEFNQYNYSFRKGFIETIYEDEPEKVIAPKVDNTNISSIGYVDGINYGKYQVMAGMKYAVKEENLIAVINKGYMRACERKENVKEKHI